MVKQALAIKNVYKTVQQVMIHTLYLQVFSVQESNALKTVVARASVKMESVFVSKALVAQTAVAKPAHLTATKKGSV